MLEPFFVLQAVNEASIRLRGKEPAMIHEKTTEAGLSVFTFFPQITH